MFSVIPELMKQNPVISYLLALIVSAIALAAGFVLYVFIRFNLAGGETLEQTETEAIIKLLAAAVPAVLAIYIAQKFFNRGRKAAAYGMSILPIIVLIANIFIYLLNYHYHTPFDKTTWQKAEWKPLNMAATLVKEENKLMGKTRHEIQQMLGTGSSENEQAANGLDAISYIVEKNWTLTIYFQNGVVVKSEMRLPWLGI